MLINDDRVYQKHFLNIAGKASKSAKGQVFRQKNKQMMFMSPLLGINQTVSPN
tara:strand:- start:2418 stop:2576 length:159 start_codon:yes stop_codon:yes gene_type:complete